MQEKMMTDTPETDASPAEPQGPTRSGFVALIGAPNAGKSTLMNQLVGAKVSIVSHKVQTTRAIVRGIAIHDRTQIVFMDTPGDLHAEAPARPRHGDDGMVGRADG
jgi:GTP-binding protein Era